MKDATTRAREVADKIVTDLRAKGLMHGDEWEEQANPIATALEAVRSEERAVATSESFDEAITVIEVYRTTDKYTRRDPGAYYALLNAAALLRQAKAKALIPPPAPKEEAE